MRFWVSIPLRSKKCPSNVPPKISTKQEKITLKIERWRDKGGTKKNPQFLENKEIAGMVPVAGLEPAHHRWQWILSPPRLPIPTHRHLHFQSHAKNRIREIGGTLWRDIEHKLHIELSKVLVFQGIAPKLQEMTK